MSFGSTLASKINYYSCNLFDYIQSNVQSMTIPYYDEYDVSIIVIPGGIIYQHL